MSVHIAFRRPAGLLALAGIALAGACQDGLTDPDGVSPAFAKGGGGKPSAGPLIAFSKNDGSTRSIHLIGEDGASERQLTTPPAGYTDRQPDFAPGNRTIVFTRESPSGTSELYTTSSDGRRIRQLTSFGAITGQATYSRDGQEIAFMSTQDGTAGLYIMDAKGTGVKQLLSLPGLGSPSWSPDGSRLAFHYRDDTIGTWHIAVLELATGSVQDVILCGWECLRPRWSPDGADLVFESYQDPAASVLYIIDVQTSSVTPFENVPAGSNAVGGWAPDGRFVFATDRTGNGDLYIRNADGGIVQLTSTPAADLQPVWSR